MNEVQPIKDLRDVEKIKNVLDGRDKLLFILGINTNLRISDLLSLTREHIVDNAIKIKEKKTGKTKHIHLGEKTMQQIEPLLPESGILFPSRKGDKAISRQQAWRILNAAAEKAGVHMDFGTHSMRKTFAYHAYKSGVDIERLMTVLNHSSAKETLRYIGLAKEDIDDVYEMVQL